MGDSAAGLFLSLLIGAVGVGTLLYGRKQGRLPQMIGGLVLCAFPYFLSNLWLMAGTAAAIVLAVWGAVKAGL